MLIERGREALEGGFTDYVELELEMEKMSALLFTSGTTGTSKGVMLSHTNLAAATNASVLSMSSDDRNTFVSVLPPHHTYEITCGHLAIIDIGGTILINDSLKHVMKNFQSFKPNALMLVPLFVETMHKRIWEEVKKKGLEKQLKALGATVIMTRTDYSYVTANDRIAAVKTKKPDYVVSIHRNGSDNSKASGFSSYYFNPYSFEAAKIMLDAADTESGFAKTKWTFNRWHLFFLCRVTECPSVLTENGFVSNKEDYALMQTEEQNQKNAKAIVDGIVNYFKQQ
jgi:acyl-CoA synthetase (AMP-forming)/AMP-acid ligase II